MSTVFNVAKGELGYYRRLPDASSAIVAVPFLAAGLVSDAIMRDYATLAEVEAGASAENTTVGRIVLSGLASAVDNGADKRTFDSANIVWAAPPASGAVGAILLCYRPGAAPADSLWIPLTKHDVTWTPDGNQMTFEVNNFAESGEPTP